MIAIGFGLAWVSYSLGLWGYSLIKGYNLGAKQIVSPTGFYSGKWPPAMAGNLQIIPDGSQADIQTTARYSATATIEELGDAMARP